MADPDFVIPKEQLPAGFADAIEQPQQRPAEPKPAATVVLLRDGQEAMQVLLLKRHRSSGFVPGAYVFPGGRTDEADADAALLEHTVNFRDMGVAAHFWFAAVREAFEETGVLLARDDQGAWLPDTSSEPALERAREQLMAGTGTLLDLIRTTQCTIDLQDVVYFAHWITPIAEPRRYDTRFFAARLPAQRTVRPDPREMIDALWLTPAEALARFAAGTLPMVFPTLRTLEQLAEFQSVQGALAGLRTRHVEPVLPRLVRTHTGVGIVIDPK